MTSSNPQTKPPRAIVAGHGSFAAGMISAVEQITGLVGVFVPVTNSGLSPGGIEAALRDAIAKHDVRVVFTDLPAGSCTMASRRLTKDGTVVTVVTGVTLPTLLAFALGAPPREALERGRDAMLVVEGGSGT
jgi:PTS system N-acetylgalactosamine-specific IIA component